MTHLPDDSRVHAAYRPYDLVTLRERDALRRVPAAHQTAALRAVEAWFRDESHPRGGILVLPTGAGKTFTAVRFLCERVLAAGYKVLWLAHTHHLLDQAADAFGAPGRSDMLPEAALIPEPRSVLRLRVVSGTVGHHRVASVQASDDVVIGTLQSVANALRRDHPALDAFLDSAQNRLCVVFDEAHHAPAPTYRRLIETLRERHPGMALLGLTATPAYAAESRRGWLLKLFPQGIIHHARRGMLVAAGVLAKPVFERVETNWTPGFSAREYAKWVAAYGDLPEHVISELADRRERNDFVVDTYARARERYGRTLIFADRWYQCDYLRSALLKRGVRADAVYTHVDADPGSADARARRTADDNARALAAFKRGEIDVLVNVRMLTEGTDVPDVQTVFLTRQTTSPVLLTQMVGRALRGPAFGGTREAYITTFVDDWSQPIEWAEFTELETGEAAPDEPTRAERAPVHLVSIALLRQLTEQMALPRMFAATTFVSSLPVGWYRAEFDAMAVGTDDVERAATLAMVFDTERTGYEAFVVALVSEGNALANSAFSLPDVTQDAVTRQLEAWDAAHFTEPGLDRAGRLLALFHLARHIAQNGEAPRFFRFAEREQHDLDALALAFVARDLGPRALRDSLRAEYDRVDRMWRSLYTNFAVFEQHHALVQQRLLDGEDNRNTPAGTDGITDIVPDSGEVPQDVKTAVLWRDGRCLCCEATNRLEVDHIAPAYFGGSNEMGNLQTLCATCNRLKGINNLNFRVNSTSLGGAAPFALLALPLRLDARSAENWERHIRRTLNHFYRCAAVQRVSLPQRGRTAGDWRVTLNPGNPVRWLDKGALGSLCDQISNVRRAAGVSGPATLTVETTGP